MVRIMPWKTRNSSFIRPGILLFLDLVWDNYSEESYSGAII